MKSVLFCLLVCLFPALAAAQDCRIHMRRADGTGDLGSGALIGDDLVITNQHVVAGGGHCSIVFWNKEWPGGAAEIDGTVECVDPYHDVAAIRLPYAPDVPIMKLADAPPKIGDWCYPIGYGGSKDERVVASGQVLRYTNTNIAGAEKSCWFNVGKAYTRGGDSGGPVMNADGELCGLRWGSLPQYASCVHVGIIRKFLNDPGWKFRQAYKPTPGQQPAAHTVVITGNK